MGKQTFMKITKILSVLLLVSFIMSVTAASASAISVKGPRDYKIGYRAGSQYGYTVGHHAGYEDCLKYGQTGVLTHIPCSRHQKQLDQKLQKRLQRRLQKRIHHRLQQLEIQVLTKINIESKLNHTIWTISTTVAAIVLAILTNSLTPELFNSYKTAIPTVLTIVN